MDTYLVSSTDGKRGTHALYRFENGYGASVISGPYTYGGDKGLFEVGVIVWTDANSYKLTYDTPVTDDVLGYLTPGEVISTLEQIKALPQATN